MKTLKTCGSLVAVSVVVMLAGCNRDGTVTRDRDRGPGPVISEQQRDHRAESTGKTTLTGAAWVTNDNAIDRIVASRCAREVTCANVGPDKHYTTSDACVLETRKRMKDDLKTAECPNGIDGVALDKCLDSIRTESCSNPLDTLNRLVSCRTGEMCLKSGESPSR